MPDECNNNNKYDVTPDRCLEARISISRSEAVNILKVDGMSKREIRLRYISLARKYHPDKWVERCNFSKAQSENIFKNVANAYDVLRS